MESQKNELNRRESLSTLAATAGLQALGLTHDASATEILSFWKQARNVGIWTKLTKQPKNGPKNSRNG